MSLLRMVDSTKIVTGLAAILPSTSTPDYVSLKDFGRITVVITVNNATTVTGSAITLKQATAVAGTGEKALAFALVWQNEDTAAAGGDIMTETAVVSDTFTTDATDNKNSQYVIEVNSEDLDTNNDFDAFRVGTGDGVATIVNVLYIMHDARYKSTLAQSVITD
jgi:hypothetical protein